MSSLSPFRFNQLPVPGLDVSATGILLLIGLKANPLLSCSCALVLILGRGRRWSTPSSLLNVTGPDATLFAAAQVNS